MTAPARDSERKESKHQGLWDESRNGVFISFSGIMLAIVGITSLVLSRLSGLLYAAGQPSTAAGYLQLFSQHQFLAFADWAFWIIGDLWLVPASIAVYLSLRSANRAIAMVGTILSLEYIVYDVVVTELDSLNLVRISQGYGHAVTDAARASFAALATNSATALPMETMFSFVIGAVGWLLWSLVMAKSVYGKWSAIVGVIVNAMGILGGVGAMLQGTPLAIVGVFTTLGAPATALWFILIGAQLFRHGNRVRRAASGPA